MRKHIISILLILFPLFLKAQNTGTNFIEGLTYKEIKLKAKSEKKKIFIALYATWCNNCKAMDPVFLQESVGAVLNENYIATKLQIDTSKNDDEPIKRMYVFADEIKKTYNISAVPTYLFLDADGNLLKIEKGVQSLKEMIEICKSALDPNESFTHLYDQYNKKKLLGPPLVKLAHYLNLLNETAASEVIAKKYRSTTLDTKEISSILNPGFLVTIREFPYLYTINDSLISYMYRNQEESDSLLKEKGISDRIVNYMINRDLIDPEIKKCASNGQTPNWDSLEHSITNRWGMNAKTNIISRKIDYYIDKKDWKQVTQLFIEKIDYQGVPWNINIIVWYYFFKQSDDPYALNKAISYMEKDLKTNPSIYSHIDTYANILYKSGHTERALEFEEKAIKMAEAKNDEKAVNTFKKCLEKMRKGIPTWTDNQFQ